MTAPDTVPDHGRETYLALRKIARDSGGAFADVLMRYKLERTLARVAAGPYGDRVVLKGGLVLAAYSARRPTKDIDSLLRDLALTEQTVRDFCAAIAGQRADDGLDYDLDTLKITEIREDATYTGYRATMRCVLFTDTQPVSFDFSTGDPVAPPAQNVVLPAVLGDDVTILGYRPEMVIAEKYVTALQRGEVNTRWRDFTDIALLSRVVQLDAPALRDALTVVSTHRGTPLVPLSDALSIPDYGRTAQTKYAAWARKNRLDHLAPATFADALAQVVELVDPIAANGTSAATWQPSKRAWILEP